MIKVKFDDNSENKLVLLWSDPDTTKENVDYSRAANLLFSIIGGGAGRWPEPPAPKRSRRSRSAGAAQGAGRSNAGRSKAKQAPVVTN